MNDKQKKIAYWIWTALMFALGASLIWSVVDSSQGVKIYQHERFGIINATGENLECFNSTSTKVCYTEFAYLGHDTGVPTILLAYQKKKSRVDYFLEAHRHAIRN